MVLKIVFAHGVNQDLLLLVPIAQCRCEFVNQIVENYILLFNHQVIFLHMPWQLGCHGMCNFWPDLIIRIKIRAKTKIEFQQNFIYELKNCKMGLWELDVSRSFDDLCFDG